MILGQFAGCAGKLQISPQCPRVFCAFCALCIGFISGCGSRHTVASRPEPAQPAASDNTERSRKSDRGNEPGVNAATRTAPAAAAKRDVAGANPAMGAYTE